MLEGKVGTLTDINNETSDDEFEPGDFCSIRSGGKFLSVAPPGNVLIGLFWCGAAPLYIDVRFFVSLGIFDSI